MSKTSNTGRYSEAGRLKLGIIVIVLLALAIIITSIIVLPKLAPVVKTDAPEVVAIIPKDGGNIGVGADLSKVYVIIRYSDNTEETKSLADLMVSGLDVTQENGELKVLLSFGGYSQEVTYNVLTTEITLTYSADLGGYIEGPTVQKIPAGTNASTVRAIAAEGYEFVSWNDGYVYAERTDTKVSSKNSYIARFRLKEYVVIYSFPDGTTAREVLKKHGESAWEDRPDPNQNEMLKYGYVFVGWKISESELKYVTRDLFVEPTYEKDAADFTLEMTKDIEGQALGSSNVKSYYPKGVGSDVRVTPNADRTFVGWYVLDYLNNWHFIAPDSVEQLVQIGGPTNYVPFGTGYVMGSGQYILSFTPTKETERISVRAEFIFNRSTISFTSMSATAHQNVEIPMDTTIGEFFEVPAARADELFDSIPLPQIIGFTFKGWYVRNGEVDSNGSPVLIKNSHTFKQSQMLVALWEKNLCEVIFEKGESENIADDIIIHVYYQDSLGGDGQNKFPDIIPEKRNYTFIGWYLSVNGVPTSKIVDKEYKVDSEVTVITPMFKVNTRTLNVSVAGLGSVKIKETGAAGDAVNITSTFYMEVDKQYTLEFRAEAGNTLFRVAVDTFSDGLQTDGVEYKPNALTYTLEIGADGVILNDYVITAEYGKSEHEITVTNGQPNGAVPPGEIIYQVIEGNELAEKTSSERNISFNAKNGVSLRLYITAAPGSYISKITVRGSNVDGIPERAERYTLIINNITAASAVEIQYEPVKFDSIVTYPEPSSGSLVEKNPTGAYTAGDVPEFSVKAAEGYYIKALRVNGAAVNPFAPGASYSLKGLAVMGNTVDVLNDERVTAYTIEMYGMTANFRVEVEFEALYYVVSVDSEGFGAVNPTYKRVSYGSSVNITASTSSGYFVSKYNVNGMDEVTFENHNSSQHIEIQNIREDKVVKVVFETLAYTVTLEGLHASVSYTDNGLPASKTLPASFVVKATSDFYFTVTAETGYKIISLRINGEEEDVAFNAKAHGVKLDNIMDAYLIEVECERITLDIKYYLGNGDGITASSPETTIEYGQPFYLNIDSLPQNRGLDAAAIIISNLLTGSRITGVEIIIDLIDAQTNSYRIRFGGITENAEIFVPVLFTSVTGSNDVHNVYISFNAAYGSVTYNADTVSGGSDWFVIESGLNASFEWLVNDAARYELKYVIINGELRDKNTGSLTMAIERDTYIEVIFDTRLYTITIDNPTGGGSVTPSTYLFSYGQSDIDVRVAPDTGYSLRYFALGTVSNMVPRDKVTVIDQINAGTMREYRIPASDAVGDLIIHIEFAPIEYKTRVNVYGNGAVDFSTTEDVTTLYESILRIHITAADRHFIESITVNGFTVEISALVNPRMNGEIGKYTEGTLVYEVRGDTNIAITFSPNIYGVTIAANPNGRTLVGTLGENKTDGTNLNLYAGDILSIWMESETGYHVESVEINNKKVDGWKYDYEQPNNNRSIYFDYAGEDGHGVQSNIFIRIIYAINNYTVKYTITNASENFRTLDTEYSQYGTFNIYGVTHIAAENSYVNIPHGADIRFLFAPVASKGYYVSVFTATWVDPDDRTSGNKAYLDGTSEAQKGQYAFNNVVGDLTVEIEFKRTLHSYNAESHALQNDSPFVSNGGLNTVFTNPYNNSTDVRLVDNKYEYGITYTVNINPGTGYSLTTFDINDIDRRGSVRANNYYGTIMGDTHVMAQFTINSYEIMLSGNTGGGLSVRNPENNMIVWQRDAVNSGEFILLTGKVTVFQNHILVTHGTILDFAIAPDSANGYRISTVYVNKAPYNFGNGYSEAVIERTLTQDTQIEVTFELIRYTLTIEHSEQGSAVTAAGSVVWGTSAIINFTLYSGYYLTGLLVNGQAATDIYEAIKDKQSATFTVDNVKQDTVVRFVYARVPYDIDFNGQYAEEFTVRGENKLSITGVVINGGTNPVKYFSSASGAAVTQGAMPIENDKIFGGGDYGPRYRDQITIYFIPIDGFKIKNFVITMGTVTIQSQSSLTYDEQNGYYYYVINEMANNITVTVNYEIKTYGVTISGLLPNGSLASSLTTIEHHTEIDLIMTAMYGYHLESIVINGETVQWENEKLQSGSYRYTTKFAGSNLFVDTYLMAGRTTLDIVFKIMVNSFEVKMFVNGKDISGDAPDTTLRPSIVNNSIIYGTNAVIIQTRTEGYSITSIQFRNNKGNVLSMSSEENFKAAQLSFAVTGGVMDMLDYHSTDNKILYVEYETQLDTHISNVGTYLYEGSTDGKTTIPNIANTTTPAFRLQIEYSDGGSQSGTVHDYGTLATFDLIIDPLASGTYRFAGFQENIDGKWSYVESGVNGVTLLSDGTRLRYNVRADRMFRAVVFRIYEITLEVHPEYKYLSGTYNAEDYNMIYSLYAKITAKVTYTSDLHPNVGALEITLNDLDGNPNNGSFTYNVLCGGRLDFEAVDDVRTNNISRSTSYYDITKAADGVTLVRTSTSYLRPGQTILSDKVVHAYYDNNVYLSFSLETKGGILSGEGGKVTYFNESQNGNQIFLSDDSLRVPTNSNIRIEIVPNANYRYNDITYRSFLSEPDSSKLRQVTNSWYPVGQLVGDGLVRIDYEGPQANPTKVIIRYTALENTIFNIQFWKRVNVTREVMLFTDGELQPFGQGANAVRDAYTPSFITGTSAAGIYDYDDLISFNLAPPGVSDTWQLRYQFVGYYINGVNQYQRLVSGFPTAYTSEYRITEEGANAITILNKDNQFKVEVIAVFIPILNVTVENEYLYDTDPYIGEKYFDVGQIEFVTYAYAMKGIQYYQQVNRLETYQGVGSKTDKSVQVMTRMNSVADEDKTVASSSYNVWTDNYITLTWSSATSQIAQRYTFSGWCYYDPVAGAWKAIPFVDQGSSTNKSTSTTFTFPVSALLSLSYFAGNETAYKHDATMYENGQPSGSYNISTIRIRPLFQRKETITIDPIVFYESEVSPATDEVAKGANDAHIEEISKRSGEIDFGRTITLNPSVRSGFEFQGWYYYENSVLTKVEYDGALDAGHSFALRPGSAGDKLSVRVEDSGVFCPRYIKIWDITVRARNESGAASFITSSTPMLRIYGVTATNDIGEVNFASSQLKEYHTEYYIPAGRYVWFGLTIQGRTNYNPTYDRYERTVSTGGTQTWENSQNEDRSNSIVLGQNTGGDNYAGIDDVLYCIKANAGKTIEVIFKTYATLTVNNVYPEAELVVPQSLATAAKLPSRMIRDGGTGDSDGVVNGVVVIKDIGITRDLDARGEYGVRFRGSTNETPITVVNSNYTGLSQLNGDSSNFTGKEYTINLFGANSVLGADRVPFKTGAAFGNGTKESPYLIYDTTDLKYMESLYTANGNSLINMYFSLMQDISAGALLAPLCRAGNGFDGTFSGNDRLIINFNITNYGQDNLGLFAKIYYGTVKDITFQGSSTRSEGTLDNVGLLAGYAYGATISGIKGASSDTGLKYASGRNNVGIVVGQATGGTMISGCVFIGNASINVAVTATGGGGLVGYIGTDSQINNSQINNPQVYSRNSTSQALGGAVGKTDGYSNEIAAMSEITVSNANLTDGGIGIYIGGVLGHNVNRKVDNLVLSGNAELQARRNTGAFSTVNSSIATQHGLGGIIGYNQGGEANGLYLGSKAGNVNGRLNMQANIAGGIVGVNTGVIDNARVGYYKMYTARTSHNYWGGVWGGVVGYNSGTVRNSSTNTQSVNNSISSDTNGAYTYFVNTTPAFSGVSNYKMITGSGNTGGTGVSGDQLNQPGLADNGYEYIGGIVGYNESGTVTGNNFTGKVITDKYNKGNQNYTLAIGGIIGYSTGGSVSGNTVTNGFIVYYNLIWVDGGSGVAALNYIGTISGNSTSGGTSSSSTIVTYHRGMGLKYTDWSSTMWGAIVTSDAKDYATGNVRRLVNSISGTSTSLTVNTTDSIPSSTWSDTHYLWSFYKYYGDVRRLTVATS